MRLMDLPLPLPSLPEKIVDRWGPAYGVVGHKDAGCPQMPQDVHVPPYPFPILGQFDIEWPIKPQPLQLNLNGWVNIGADLPFPFPKNPFCDEKIPF